MPLTRKQIILFGKTWTATKKSLLAKDPYLTKEELETERQDMLRLAGARSDNNGRYSVKTLTNTGFSKFLDLLETTMTGKPNQRRSSRSIIWKIDQLGLDEPYLDSIARDQFKVDSWRTLSRPQLLNFIRTCTARATALKP